MFSVYCHENKTNGKVYVGITGQDPKHRWLNGGGYSKNKKFSKDIKQYGWDGFTHRIVADGLTEQQAIAIEKEMIAAYDARHLGYNNDDGGKYVSKRALSHEANEVKHGIANSPYANLYGCKCVLDCFEEAERQGKDSNFCHAINLCVTAILARMRNDNHPIRYSDGTWISDFVWEWNRYFSISAFCQTHTQEEIDEAIKEELFPAYNSHKRYEQAWNKIMKF